MLDTVEDWSGVPHSFQDVNVMRLDQHKVLWVVIAVEYSPQRPQRPQR